MPEEINRILTDSISNFLFVTEQSGMINLAKENVADEKVFFTGNVMIDSLVYYRQKSKAVNILMDLGIHRGEYILTTMHRPANVDNAQGLESIIKILENASKRKKVVFPIHPRTKNNTEKFGLTSRLKNMENLILLEPQGYLQFLALMDNASLIITDSGGIQEETTFLQVPCLTFRDSTERPVTVELGTNQLLADLNPETVKVKMEEILEGKRREGTIPPLWDGHAAERIAETIISKLG